MFLSNIILAAAEPSMWFVALIGMGTVFIGLVCIIFICAVMSKIVKLFEKSAADKPVLTGTPKPQLPAAIENRAELVAAIQLLLQKNSEPILLQSVSTLLKGSINKNLSGYDSHTIDNG